jgi:hypothetical protein
MALPGIEPGLCPRQGHSLPLAYKAIKDTYGFFSASLKFVLKVNKTPTVSFQLPLNLYLRLIFCIVANI